MKLTDLTPQQQETLLRDIRQNYAGDDCFIILTLWLRIGELKDEISRAGYPDTTGR